MTEWENAATEQELAFGCLFCITGKEQALATLINRTQSVVKAFVAKQEQFHSQQGVKSKVEKVLMPGYVFFHSPPEEDIEALIPRDHLIRILTTDDGVWQLYGEDERFVRWLWQYGGTLGFSKAMKEGTRIKIISGPMKDLEGKIRKVDKRGRSGQVALEFCGKTTLVWLCFDLIDVTDKQVLMPSE